MPESWVDKQIVHMVATWTHLGLELFDLDAWGAPEVHPSAAADILAGAHPPDANFKHNLTGFFILSESLLKNPKLCQQHDV